MKKTSPIKVVKLSLVAVIISTSGWLVFSGVNQLFNLSQLSAYSSIGLGLLVGYLTYFFGIKK